MLAGWNFGTSTLWMMSFSFSATHFMQQSKSRKMYLLFGVWSVVCGQTKIWSFNNQGDTLSLTPTHFMQHSKSRKMYLLFGVLIAVCRPPKGVHTLQSKLQIVGTSFEIWSVAWSVWGWVTVYHPGAGWSISYIFKRKKFVFF